MSKPFQPIIGRRDMLRVLTAGAVVAAGVAAPFTPAQAEAKSNADPSRARYRANSPDVQSYYRVNRYPTRCGRRPC
jgi:hypothetical protein